MLDLFEIILRNKECIDVNDLDNVWIDSTNQIKAILIQDGTIDIITDNAELKINNQICIEKSVSIFTE